MKWYELVIMNLIIVLVCPVDIMLLFGLCQVVGLVLGATFGLLTRLSERGYHGS